MRHQCTITYLLFAILVIAIVLASAIEQRSVIGQSTTVSPDETWSFELVLVEYSTLFQSRKILNADMVHFKNKNWNVSTSIPLNHADAKTISNRHPDHPILWSDDSSTVSYWINEQLKDSITISANQLQREFKRDLHSISVKYTPKKSGG